MSATFNPYREWLGIPDNGQPLNYYRLLGLTIFESNPATIERAVQYRLARIESVASPEHAAAAQAIAGEIILARNFLLSPASKEAYDRGLQASASAPPVAVVARPSEPTVVAGPSAPRPVAVASTKPSATRPQVAFWRQPLVILASAAAVVILGGLVFMVRTAEDLDEEPDSVAAHTATVPSAALSPGGSVEDGEEASQAEEQPPATSETIGNRPIAATARDNGVPAVPSNATKSTVSEDETPPNTASAEIKSVDTDVAPGAEPAVSQSARAVENPEIARRRLLSGAEPTPPLAPEQRAAVPQEVPTAGPDETQASSPPDASARPSLPWLRSNKVGEPYEVALTDGSVLELDTYGDSYQGYRGFEPVDGVNKSEVVVDYQRDRLGSGIGAYFMQLDVQGRRMYWIESGGDGACHIRAADINGRSPRIILNLPQQGAQALAIDPKRGKLYWANHAAGGHPAFGAPPEAAQAVWQADLDGSNPHPLFSGLREPGAVAVETQTGRVFYFTERRLIRGEMDGSNETPVLESLDGSYRGVTLLYKGRPKNNFLIWTLT